MEWTSSLEFEAIIDAQRRPLSPEARMIFKIVGLILRVNDLSSKVLDVRIIE
jgi:hypothetical protein